MDEYSKKGIGERDFGRRLYVGKRPYRHKMAQTTHSAVDRFLKAPHSESKKPYREPDIPYDQMEYQFDPWNPNWPRPPELPPVGPNDPSDPGNPPTITPNINPPPPGFMGCEFFQPLTPNVVGPGETAYARLARRDDPVIRLEVHGPAKVISGSVALCTNAGQQVLVGTPQWSANSSECTVIIQAKKDISGYQPNSDGVIQIVVVAYTASGSSCSTSATVRACPPSIELEWDWDVSPQSMGQSDIAIIAIKGGLPPFTWTTDNGALKWPKTNGRSNTIYSTPDFCGGAVITVIDACGEAASGSIRSTAGYWANIGWQSWCPFSSAILSDDTTYYPAGADSSCPSGNFRATQGKWRVVHCYKATASLTGAFPNCPPQCPAHCMDLCFGAGCHPTLGCSHCIYPHYWQYTGGWRAFGGMCSVWRPDYPNYLCPPDIGPEYGVIWCYCLQSNVYTVYEWRC